MKRVLKIFALVPILAGCAGGEIVQNVVPYTGTNSKPYEICVITNAKVKPTVLDAYKDSLIARGLTVRILPAGSAVGSCPVTSTYLLRWAWDIGEYMVYADFKVYSGNQLAGEAVYDATNAPGSFDKFVHVNQKIDELTGKLFPN
ncbi:MAG: Sbal_3080 family lipoprotein [Rhizomicrobium sp.]|jgi:hypothetical protein